MYFMVKPRVVLVGPELAATFLYIGYLPPDNQGTDNPG